MSLTFQSPAQYPRSRRRRPHAHEAAITVAALILAVILGVVIPVALSGPDLNGGGLARATAKH